MFVSTRLLKVANSRRMRPLSLPTGRKSSKEKSTARAEKLFESTAMCS